MPWENLLNNTRASVERSRDAVLTLSDKLSKPTLEFEHANALVDELVASWSTISKAYAAGQMSTVDSMVAAAHARSAGSADALALGRGRARARGVSSTTHASP